MKNTSLNLITKLLLLVAIVLCSVTAWGQVKTIDIRNESNAQGNSYYLVFIASKSGNSSQIASRSATGHAFITFGVENRRGRRSDNVSYGHYATRGIDYLGRAPGKVKREFDSRYLYNCARLIVKVDYDDMKKANRIIKRYRKSGKYQVIKNDCTTMMLEVARAIGLKTPRRSLLRNALPYKAITSLISKN